MKDGSLIRLLLCTREDWMDRYYPLAEQIRKLNSKYSDIQVICEHTLDTSAATDGGENKFMYRFIIMSKRDCELIQTEVYKMFGIYGDNIEIKNVMLGDGCIDEKLRYHADVDKQNSVLCFGERLGCYCGMGKYIDTAPIQCKPENVPKYVEMYVDFLIQHPILMFAKFCAQSAMAETMYKVCITNSTVNFPRFLQAANEYNIFKKTIEIEELE